MRQHRTIENSDRQLALLRVAARLTGQLDKAFSGLKHVGALVSTYVSAGAAQKL